MPISPTAEGFRAAFRRPLLTFAEITWRWVVGASATVLFFFGFFEFLDTLPVSNGELLFLRTRHPFLVSQAMAHILRGSLSRGVLSLVLAAILLSLAWIVAASLGRVATVEAMIDYFRARFREFNAADANPVATSDISKRDQTFALLRLNFLRVSVFLGGIVGLGGAATIAGFASSPEHPHPALAFLLFLPIAVLVRLIWYVLNWFLSLASVFVIRDGEDAVDAISSAAALCRERTGAVFAVSTWTGLAHLIAFAGASTVVSFPLALAGFLPWRLVALGVLLVTLTYLAFADWLYTARLAGYVCIAEAPNVFLAAMPPPARVPPEPTPLQTSIDRDEPILSDLPNLVVEI